MNIHLHHAISHTLSAASNLGHAAMWDDSATLRNQGINYAREYLAKATAELAAYEAMRAVKREAAE